MEKLATWALIGLLAYISAMVTSINSKLEVLNSPGTQYAVLNETKTQSYSGGELQQVVLKDNTQSSMTPLNAALMLTAMISLFASWHFSRIYHKHQWTKSILRKTFSQYGAAYRQTATYEPIHMDQDCIGDPALPDGRIKDSWLPPSLKRLDIRA